jgi:hypothetical protein
VTKDREPPSLADYVVTALSPTLIMALVGSLAFFLLDILYAGQWTDRLRWTLFFFVVGAVLIGRVSIQIDTNRAWIYRLILGGAAFLAMWRFVEYPADGTLSVAGPVINIIIVAVVLWSANKLTWDCTFVDESAEDGGGGLLEEVREEMLNSPPSPGFAGEGPGVRVDFEKPEEPSPPTPLPQSRERGGKPMGRWVVYFSLAALPLFGLGQALIPADDEGRRRYSFWLMTVYVGSGLGLLLTTTLLGLRRYLRQRKLQMPGAMTGLWLGVGAVLIAAFLIVAALLPLSHPQYSLIPIQPSGSADPNASRYAMRSNNAGKGEGRGGGDGNAENAKDGSGGKGQEGGKAAGQSGKPEGQGGDKAGGKGKSDSQSKAGADPNGKQSGSGPKSDQSDQSSASPPSPPGVFATIANVVKWIALIVLAIVVALVVLWFMARHMSGASDWARKLFEALSAFWRSLFGGSAPEEGDVEETVVVQERPKPFADFRNPFADGSAAGRSPDALVRYSFAALEAWAFERDLPRRTDETPLEFADRVGAEVPTMADDSQRLTGLYARLAYAGRRLPEASREPVEAFWRALETSPLSPSP